MKKQTNTYSLLFCAFLCLLLASIFSIGHAGSIREEIAGIVTIDSLENYYLENRDNLYKKRYILKYIPKFLEDAEISSVPQWIYNAVNESLDSDYDALIEEAMTTAGKLGMAGTIGKITEIFKEAPQKYSAYSSILRSAAIGSILRIGGDCAKSSVPVIIGSISSSEITQPEFSSILMLVELHGNTQVIDSLRNFKTYADNESSNKRAQKDERKIEDRYQKASDALTRVIKKFEKKEAPRE